MYDASILHAALCSIAAQCDGALTEDTVGFNGQDTLFGRRIANHFTAADYDEELAAEVYRTLQKYKVQLANYGHPYDQIPVPPKVIEETSRAARDRARQAEKGKKYGVQVIMDERISGTSVVLKGNTFDVKDKIRQAGGKWDGSNRVWLVPVANASQIKWLVHQFPCEVDKAVETLIENSDEREPEAIVEEKAMAIVPSTGTALVMWQNVRNFNVLLSEIKLIPGRQYDNARKLWIVPICEELSDYGHRHDFAGVDAIDIELDKVNKNRAQDAMLKHQREKASRAHNTDLDVALAEHLFPFQKAGVAYFNLISNGCGIIGDEMGLGKTRQGLAVLEDSESYPAVIVCPAHLKANWLENCRTLLPHRSAVSVSGREPMRVDADIIVINYDILPSWGDEMVEVNGQMVPLLQPKGLLCDESHYIKTHKANRTKAVLAMADRVRQGGGRVVMLTGTPVVNRPVEFITQLQAVGHIGAFGGVSAFQQNYCLQIDEYGRASYGGANNLTDLNRKIRETCYVRREKMDVLTELPPKMRSDIWVDMDPLARAHYEAAKRDIISYLRDVLGRGAAARNAARAETLVKLNQLRQIVGNSKIKLATEWVLDFLESTGRQLVVFAQHQKVQNEIAKALTDAGIKVVRIEGGQDANKRDQAVKAFQAGDAQVIVCSVRAGGTGLTLTAASDVLLVEQGWTPAEHQQAEDRCHRIGQSSNVTAHYLLVQNSMDSTLHSLLAAKTRVVNAVAKGEEADVTPAMMDAVVDALVS